MADQLRRTLTLPWLVFYGVGVTVGAGIFALIGEVLAIAGDHAPLSFLLAGLIAGVTGVSYALLIARFPRAGGEAVFVNKGLGTWPGRLVGYGVVTTGIISSAVVSLAFGGYVSVLVPVPGVAGVTILVVALAGVAWLGVRESVVLAGLITLLEAGTIAIVVVFGFPLLGDFDAITQSLTPAADGIVLTGIVSGGVLAFFAFIGFEDIVNVCEETVRPKWTVPRAIYWTLGITIVLYVLLAVIAALAPDRDLIIRSPAPLAQLFENISGRSGTAVAAVAVVAMINGVLVQIVMASRVLYGMANEGLAPTWFASVDTHRKTPARATFFVAVIILLLAWFFPLVRLAEATSLVTLSVFCLVNLALFTLGGRLEDEGLRRFRWWGLFGALICAGIAGFQILSGVTGGH